MWISQALKQEDATLSISEKDKFNELTTDDKYTVVYIKIRTIINPDKYSMFTHDSYLFLTEGEKVILSYNNNRLIINKDLTEEHKEVAHKVNMALSTVLDLYISHDDFAIDFDTNSIYIGKAANDYVNSLVLESERILH